MYAQRKMPVLVAALVAVAGTAVILLNDFSPYGDSRGVTSASIVTAAAVSKAGAIETPTGATF